MGLERDKQSKVYKEFWTPIENNCKVTDGEKIINYVSDFLRDYLTLKNNKIPVKNKVFEEFKSFYKNIDDLEEIKEYSKCYAMLKKPNFEKELVIKKKFGIFKSIGSDCR